MSEERRNGMWWLAALVVPLGVAAVGGLAGLAAPANQNDWMGMRIMVPIVWGLVGASLSACVLAGVSVLRRERHGPIALLPGIPSLCFLIWFGGAYQDASRHAQQRASDDAGYRRKREEEQRQIEHWHLTFLAQPALATSGDFWREQAGSRHLALLGLTAAFQDVNFAVGPAMKEYFVRNFPDEAFRLFMAKRCDPDELVRIVKDATYRHDARQAALDTLLRNPTFEVTAEWKRVVLEQFPSKVGLLFGGRKFTRNELESLAQDPTVPLHLRREAANWLKAKSYQEESGSTSTR